MPDTNNNILINLKQKNNQFYESGKFRLDLDEGRHLRDILVEIYPDRDSINTIYREQGNDLRALSVGSITPDALWLEVLDNLSLFTKLEAFIRYLFKKNINEKMDTILLSIDPTLTRIVLIPNPIKFKEKLLKLLKKLLKWFLYVFIFTIIVGFIYLIITLIFPKSTESEKYYNSPLYAIIDRVNSDFFDGGIKSNTMSAELQQLYIKGEYYFYRGKAEQFFKQIESANDCLEIIWNEKNHSIHIQFKENITPVRNDDPLAMNTYKCPS